MLRWSVACFALLSVASVLGQQPPPGRGGARARGGEPPASPPAQGLSIEQAEEQAQRMVVMIESKFGEESSIGAGIIFDKPADSLYIVTANHVVRRGTTDAGDIRVRLRMLPGERLPAKLLDPFTDQDLAVLKVEGLSAAVQRDLASLRLDRLGDVDAVKVRDEVYTIGQPSGKRWDVSAGGDLITGVEAVGFAFRSSSVAPGSSGGALFNAQRLLIGLVQKDVPPSAEAIRIDVVMRILRAEKYSVTWQRPTADGGTQVTNAAPVTGPGASQGAAASARGIPVTPVEPATGGRGRGLAPTARGGGPIPEEAARGRPVAIMNANSGLCLTIAGGGTAQNATAVQYTCDADPSRFWVSIAVDGANIVQLRNLNSGLCLTIAGGGTARNATAVQYTCDSDPSRRWRTIRGDEGRYRFVNVNSGLCLTIAGGATDQNLAAVQYPCDGDRSREWQFRTAR